jgi:hypothetical protein
MTLADMFVRLWVLVEQFIWACLDECSGASPERAGKVTVV